MSTLVFDTETSGLWRDDLPAMDPNQPHLVQLGAQLFDRHWNKRGHLNVLIRPDGWEIEKQAEAVHGISTATCHRYGVALAEALVAFRAVATPAARVVAHNLAFDRKILAVAIHRAGGEGVWWHRMAPKFLCTMEAATDACQLPATFGGFKWPSLEEALAVLLPDRQIAVRHDTDSDVVACAALYRELIERGVVVEPDPFAIGGSNER